MSALLQVANLSKQFVVRRDMLGRPTATVHAVDGVSFVLAAGETLALVGESGCGKSTVGRLLLRLIEPSGGSIRFDGQDVLSTGPAGARRLRRDVQLIFQDPYASLNPRMTVGEILGEPLLLHDVVPANRRRDRVAELLTTVGLRADHHRRYPHEFSGGQRQRIAIARALAVEPKLIVCDEPVSALDVSIRAQVLNLLRDLQTRLGLAYLFISHDLAVVKHIATRVAVMYLGRIVETGEAERVFAEPRHPYTRALLSAIPVPAPGARQERRILQGDVPSPILAARLPSAHALPACGRPLPRRAPDADMRDGHGVACHLWRQLPPAGAALPKELAPNPTLEKLQAAFVRRTEEVA